MRNYVLESLERLERKKIDQAEMATIAKSSETIMSSLKLQLTYSAMRSETPHIDFLQNCNDGKTKLIEKG
jgi:hypothetical protein